MKFILNPYLYYSSNPPTIFNLLTSDIIECNQNILNKIQEFIIKKDGSNIPLLSKIGIIISEKNLKETEDKYFGAKDYLPTNVTILPTWDCNMRCIYCYSNGGIGEIKTIPFHVAQASIDYIIENSLNLGTERSNYNKKFKHYHHYNNDCDTSLTFHGGGEPLLEQNQELLNKIINYYRMTAQNNGLSHRVSVSTNGAIRENRYSWVLDNIDHFSISLDGPPDTQNYQRPLVDGQSFDIVSKFIKHLDEQGRSYGIRTTITNESVNIMTDMIEYFHNNFKVKNIHFEPLFSCGRCISSPDLIPEKNLFSTNFLKAKELSYKYDIDVYYSGNRNGRPSGAFCGAASGSNFFITPDGKVTTCVEVSRTNDPGSEIFHIGEYDALNHNFNLDSNKISELRKRNSKNLSGCGNCIAKLSCAGGCLAKTYWHNGSIHKTGNQWWCQVNKELLLKEIESIIELKGR